MKIAITRLREKAGKDAALCRKYGHECFTVSPLASEVYIDNFRTVASEQNYDTYTNHTKEFNNLFTNLDTWSFISSIFGTYEIYCGATLFWLIIIIIPYLMMWIKQGSVIIPAIFALLSGSVLFALVPVEAIAPIKILLTIGIAGIFYHIIKSK